MLALHTRAKIARPGKHNVLKVLGLEEALADRFPRSSILVDLRAGAPADHGSLASVGFGGVLAATRPDAPDATLSYVTDLADDKVVAPGDVVRIRENGQVSVLFRRGANANALFITERCNSLCLMCSQPPRDNNDDWRIDEHLQTIPLIDKDLAHLGFTGGEPTLLGPRLAEIIDCSMRHLPHTSLHILTNGRRFCDATLVREMRTGMGKVCWAIPLYSDLASQHDYVVQAQGAFEETINGIYNLAEQKHAIEIRVVLHAQTVERLVSLMEFIWRTMPFVSHVALMGLEPMGFARKNKEILWVDPLDYMDTLEAAAWYLYDRGIPVSIYNIPLCLLPRRLWQLARMSISDWKNLYAEECAGCGVRDSCCGFFMSAGRNWRSRGISPVHDGGAP